MNYKSTLFRVSLGAGAVIAALALDVRSDRLATGFGVSGLGSSSSLGNSSSVFGMVPVFGLMSDAYASGSRPNAAQKSEQNRQAEQPQRLETSKLTIVSKGGKRHVFTVEMAHTPQEQEIGMMYRKSVEPDAGMLFPFPRPRQASFWMYNTYIPLDLIFIDKNGRIESIAPNAVPHSLKPLQSRGAVVAVLEIAGGRAAELGIAEGDEILHPELPRR